LLLDGSKNLWRKNSQKTHGTIVSWKKLSLDEVFVFLLYIYKSLGTQKGPNENLLMLQKVRAAFF
jgi:hypothetical protein